MARYLDFLVAFDEYLDRNDLDYLIYGHEMFGISESAGLTARADQSPARWTGQLVEGGYIQHGPLGYGDRRPLIPPSYLPEDLSRVSDYRMTATGRTEADRVRRQRRDAMTDASLGGELPEFVVAALSDVQRLAVAGPLTHLRSALDNEHPVAAVGAAKDLVEAACKVVIAAAGQAPSGGESLPGLFKQVTGLKGGHESRVDVGRSLAATVQRLAELRNLVGAGHGRAVQPEVTMQEARLAATAAYGVALYLLDPTA